MNRRTVVGALVAVGAASLLAACSGSVDRPAAKPSVSANASEQASSPRSAETDQEAFTRQAAESLIAMHEVDAASGGWKFKSAIQDGHYQTDRDVGASSVAMGFLNMAEQYPDEPQWLDAATKTAVWLTAVSHSDGHGGRYWNDYNDPGDNSASVYTSFDDGTIGIGDFYWQLYEKTHDPAHMDMALAALKWTLSQSDNISKNDGIPSYRWRWDMSDNESPHYMGMGMGETGIVNSLATFYERTRVSNPKLAADCKQHIDGALRYIAGSRQALGAEIDEDRPLPETSDIHGDGGTALNSGYLSGAAGGAYMYLKLYQVFGDKSYLDTADEFFDWLNEDSHNEGPRVNFADGTTAWKIMLDPEDENDGRYATGFEEGNAGIGWTYLQAYHLTGDKQYLKTARQAADWLLEVSNKNQVGLSWNEDENADRAIVHANLNNGAAGIGMFLKDMYLATGDKKYDAGASGALKWLMASAKHDGDKLSWNDNDGDNEYSADPSWHWGTAGIVAASNHIQGGRQDTPGEQPGLTRGR